MYTYLVCLVIGCWSYCRSILVVSTIRCVSANVCFFLDFIYYDLCIVWLFVGKWDWRKLTHGIGRCKAGLFISPVCRGSCESLYIWGHRGIAKWIRECQAGGAHYFDIWHVARSISKATIKLGKENGCEKIADWVKGARNHLYWCVTSSRQGFEELVTAKWKSFMQHVVNRHDNHPSPLFKKCTQDGKIENRKWILIGNYYSFAFLRLGFHL